MAATKVEVKVELNLNPLVSRLEDLKKDSSFMYSVNNSLARYCHPYVPYLHGPLSETIEVTPEHVLYVQPYARRQYYGDSFNFTKDKHPLATSRWDEAMMRDRGDQFTTEVGDLISRRLRVIYG